LINLNDIDFKDYQTIYDDYMSGLNTQENMLTIYGGPVTAQDTKMDLFGELKLTFSRPVVFPTTVLTIFDDSYEEEVPELKPTQG
jgi:hypothetical protein